MKKSKGITLVALIITIIVLLILAVVTIAAVNEGSLFEHANNAAKKYTTAAEEENSIISRYMSKINGGPEIKFTIGALASRATGYNTEDNYFEIPISELNDLIGANIVDLKDYYFRTAENCYVLCADMSDLTIEDEGTVLILMFLSLGGATNEEIYDAAGLPMNFEGMTEPDFMVGTMMGFLDGMGPTSKLSFGVAADLNEETVPFASVEEMPEEIKNYEIKLLNLSKIKDLYRKYGNTEGYDF